MRERPKEGEKIRQLILPMCQAMGAEVSGVPSTATVRSLFAMGAPPYPSSTIIDALSAPVTALNPNGMIYLRPSAIKWETLVHEAAHQVHNYESDNYMLLGLAILYGLDVSKGGVDPNGRSQQITDKIKEKCL